MEEGHEVSNASMRVAKNKGRCTVNIRLPLLRDARHAAREGGAGASPIAKEYNHAAAGAAAEAHARVEAR